MERLQAVHRHLVSSSADAPTVCPASASTAAAPSATLLTDAQVREFITRGVLTLPVSDLSDDFHAAIHAEAERMFDKGIGLGNDIYPGISGLKDVLESATVAGALTSLLGPASIFTICWTNFLCFLCFSGFHQFKNTPMNTDRSLRCTRTGTCIRAPPRATKRAPLLTISRTLFWTPIPSISLHFGLTFGDDWLTGQVSQRLTARQGERLSAALGDGAVCARRRHGGDGQAHT